MYIGREYKSSTHLGWIDIWDASKSGDELGVQGQVKGEPVVSIRDATKVFPPSDEATGLVGSVRARVIIGERILTNIGRSVVRRAEYFLTQAFAGQHGGHVALYSVVLSDDPGGVTFGRAGGLPFISLQAQRYRSASDTACVQAPSGVLVITGWSVPPASRIETVRS